MTYIYRSLTIEECDRLMKLIPRSILKGHGGK